ncbi:MAG: hypothetical protein QM564_12385 [Bergeyella sp.]
MKEKNTQTAAQNLFLSFWKRSLLLFVVFPVFFSSQIYIVESTSFSVQGDAFVYSDTGIVKRHSPVTTEKTKIYIAKGAVVYNLAEHTNAEPVYLTGKKPKPEIRRQKISVSYKNPEKPAAKQKTDSGKPEKVYKPQNYSSHFYFYALQEKAAAAAGSSFSGKNNAGALSGLQAPTTLQYFISKGGKAYGSDEDFTSFLISYKSGRAPPVP